MLYLGRSDGLLRSDLDSGMAINRSFLMIARLKSALLLIPAVLLLLVWIAVYGNTAEILRAGIPFFLAWAAAMAFGIAYCVTLYVDHLRR